MKQYFLGIKRAMIIAFLFVLVFAFGGCASPQEENGVGLLPHNHPTTKELKNDMGIPLY